MGFNPQRGGYKQTNNKNIWFQSRVSIPKGEATNPITAISYENVKLFQSPKGRLQTEVKIIEKEGRKMFQSPKGRLQTNPVTIHGCLTCTVSIPKGEATNFGKSRTIRGNVEVSIPKGEATNSFYKLLVCLWNILFQSPKGRLQTSNNSILSTAISAFQSPKGRLQTIFQTFFSYV